MDALAVTGTPGDEITGPCPAGAAAASRMSAGSKDETGTGSVTAGVNGRAFC